MTRLSPFPATTYENRSPGARGFTVLEVTMAMFVLVFGLLGVLALFPVGMNSSKICIESTNCAILAQSALEYLKVGPMYGVTWPTIEQPLYPTGSISAVTDAAPSSRLTCLPTGIGTWTTSWAGYIFMITSGPLAGKPYEIASSAGNVLTFTRGQFNNTDSGQGDYVYPGVTFQILGQTTNTIPPSFFVGPPYPTSLFAGPTYPSRLLARTESLNPPDFAVPTDANSECEYSVVCILSGRMPNFGTDTSTVRADVLIYRNFDRLFGPEANRPPIRRFVTYLSR